MVFKFVHDAQRVWVEGRQQQTRRNGEEYGTDDNIGGALDGNGGVVNNGKPVENSDSNNCTTSLVALGVELRAVHTSNHVVLDSESFREGGDSYYNSQGGYIDDNYRYEGGDEVDANGVQSGRVGGSNNRRSQNNTMCRSVSDGHSYHHGHSTSQDGCAPPSKLPRYSDDRYAMDSQQHHETSHVSPASASIQSSTPNNNNTYYPRATAQSTYQKPDQQEIQLSSIELQLQQQEEAEEWAKWEAFQLEEKEWRKRRHVEYNNFINAKNERSTQISTLEQKRELLSKQEHMLNQQLPLHKKMLVMLKSKNATPSEQSTKMKEILSTSKRIVELKTELKGVIEDIEKMKEVESNHGVFRPSEKRPVFSGNMVDPNARVVPGKKRSLDRRTTMLKVRGFDDAGNANEVSGTHTSVVWCI